MLKPIYIPLILLGAVLFSCHPTGDKHEAVTASTQILREGMWRFEMELPKAKLPFNVGVKKLDSVYELTVENDIEKITVKDVLIANDSFIINMPVFQSILRGKILSDTTLEGYWQNLAKGSDYLIHFKGSFGGDYRFFPNSEGADSKSFEGKYEVTFSPNSEDPCKAIGLFRQTKNLISGTFITETGDYRFLEGQVRNDSMFLSCFDGSHAFLFEAKGLGNTISGNFWSGKHWQEPWVAIKNDAFELTNPDSLTFLKAGFDQLSFSFPNLDSSMVSLGDDKYQNKVVLVQIMGSWCPNCADETAFLTNLYEKYHKDGLEVVALAYEKSTDFSKAVKAVNKLKNHFNSEYDFLIAGKADKKEAQKTLPMLNHIMSYPTCIFIDRDMRIRKIRTGFYGPGTGSIHREYIKEIEAFTEMLLMKSPV